MMHFTWKQFESAVDILYDKINNDTIMNYKNIYGIPYCGVELAVALSQKLDVPHINNKYMIKTDTLITDDISDIDGQLMQLLQDKPYNKIATIFATLHTRVNPDYYVHSTRNEEKIKFPWEK